MTMDERKRPPAAGSDIDPDVLRRLQWYMNQPLDLGFPEGYRPAEF